MMEPPPPPPPTDRLSSLPRELRDEILVRLDLRDAVRTSALSRAWRRVWASLPELSISFPRGTHPSAVDSVFLRYTGPLVRRFAVHIDKASADRVHDWLLALSRLRVESIDIRAYLRSGEFNLHPSIFACDSLVSLQLYNCNITPLPGGFAGFPALQELNLTFVQFSATGGNQLEDIVRRSPLLHVLKMYCVFIPEDCPDSVIQAPNLRILSIFDEYDYGWRLGELPCLEDAAIDVSLYVQHGHDIGGLLARLAQVRKLAFFPPSMEIEIPYTLSFTFDNLKSLKLITHFTQVHPILLMFTLLRSSPNLENLKLVIRIDDDQDINTSCEFLNAQWTDGMCANLRHVQMFCTNWLPNEISFMKLILSKAGHLRTLYFKDSEPPEYFDDQLIDLLKCKRASAQARVRFEGLEQEY